MRKPLVLVILTHFEDSNQNDVDQPDDNLARFDSPFDDSESQLDSQSVYAPSLHDDSDQETLQSNPEDKVFYYDCHHYRVIVLPTAIDCSS